MKYLKYFEAVTNRFLYHFTGKIKEILESNRINLSSHLGTPQDKSDRFFFLSLSRSPDPFAGFGRLGGETGYSRIVFDKDKLKQRFKIVPFDYWQEKDVEKLSSFRAKQPLKDISYEINQRFEFEDRLISDKAYIDNASKYIERIDLIYNTEYMNAQGNNLVFQQIQLAKKLGIKVFVYKNKKDMMYAKNNIANDIKWQQVDDEDNYPEKEDFNFERLIALFIYDKKYMNNDELLSEELKKYLDKYNINFHIDEKEVRNRIWEIYNGSRDFLTSIEADFHNYFKGGKSGKLRDIINIFVNQMKKLGLKTIRELYYLKRDGLRPKTWTKKDWNKEYTIYKLEWDYDAEDNYSYKKIDSNDLYKNNHIYFTTPSYGGYILEEEWYKIHEIEITDGTIGDVINYLFNKYTESKAKELIEKSSYDSYLKRNQYKLEKPV